MTTVHCRKHQEVTWVAKGAEGAAVKWYKPSKWHDYIPEDSFETTILNPFSDISLLIQFRIKFEAYCKGM